MEEAIIRQAKKVHYYISQGAKWEVKLHLNRIEIQSVHQIMELRSF